MNAKKWLKEFADKNCLSVRPSRLRMADICEQIISGVNDDAIMSDAEKMDLVAQAIYQLAESDMDFTKILSIVAAINGFK